MAQLFYRYGTMNSGKSIELLKVAHNYEEQGKRVIIMTSAIDTRSGFGKVESRIGVSKPAIAITSEMDVYGVDLSQYLGHILVETVKPFFLLLILQIPVGLDSESSYGFDFGYKILQCS